MRRSTILSSRSFVRGEGTHRVDWIIHDAAAAAAEYIHASKKAHNIVFCVCVCICVPPSLLFSLTLESISSETAFDLFFIIPSRSLIKTKTNN